MAMINSDADHWNEELYWATFTASLSKVIDIVTTQSNNPNFNINHQNVNNGYTSLYYASAWGFIGTADDPSDFYEIVKFLLDNGADPNIRNKDGKSPLWIAASWGHYHIVRLLISKGADLNVQVKGDSLFSPLQIAAYFQRHMISGYTKRGKYHAYYMAIGYIEEIINTEKGLEYFPEIEEDLDALKKHPVVSTKEDTPEAVMNIVSKYNHFAVVDELVLAGADINLPDENGSTALEKAKRWNHEAMEKLLRKYGGVEGVKNEVKKEIW